MMTIQQANLSHVKGIMHVCSSAWRATYQNLHSSDYIERVIEEYYNYSRIQKEVTEFSPSWGGYFVALDGEKVVGAAGGGMIGETIGELFVLYLDPDRRREGIGTLLLDAVTQQQKEWGAKEQWVSVTKGNDKGFSFYEARGFVLPEGSPNKQVGESLRVRRSLEPC